MDLVALKFIAIGLMVFAMLGVTLGVAHIFSSILNGIARNPGAEEKMRTYVYVGAGMIEVMGFLAFVIAMILIFRT